MSGCLFLNSSRRTSLNGRAQSSKNFVLPLTNKNFSYNKRNLHSIISKNDSLLIFHITNMKNNIRINKVPLFTNIQKREMNTMAIGELWTRFEERLTSAAQLLASKSDTKGPEYLKEGKPEENLFDLDPDLIKRNNMSVTDQLEEYLLPQGSRLRNDVSDFLLDYGDFSVEDTEHAVETFLNFVKENQSSVFEGQEFEEDDEEAEEEEEDKEILEMQKYREKNFDELHLIDPSTGKSRAMLDYEKLTGRTETGTAQILKKYPLGELKNDWENSLKENIEKVSQITGFSEEKLIKYARIQDDQERTPQALQLWRFSAVELPGWLHNDFMVDIRDNHPEIWNQLVDNQIKSVSPQIERHLVINETFAQYIENLHKINYLEALLNEYIPKTNKLGEETPEAFLEKLTELESNEKEGQYFDDPLHSVALADAIHLDSIATKLEMQDQEEEEYKKARDNPSEDEDWIDPYINEMERDREQTEKEVLKQRKDQREKLNKLYQTIGSSEKVSVNDIVEFFQTGMEDIPEVVFQDVAENEPKDIDEENELEEEGEEEEEEGEGQGGEIEQINEDEENEKGNYQYLRDLVPSSLVSDEMFKEEDSVEDQKIEEDLSFGEEKVVNKRALIPSPFQDYFQTEEEIEELIRQEEGVDEEQEEENDEQMNDQSNYEPMNAVGMPKFNPKTPLTDYLEQESGNPLFPIVSPIPFVMTYHQKDRRSEMFKDPEPIVRVKDELLSYVEKDLKSSKARGVGLDFYKYEHESPNIPEYKNPPESLSSLEDKDPELILDDFEKKLQERENAKLREKEREKKWKEERGLDDEEYDDEGDESPKTFVSNTDFDSLSDNQREDIKDQLKRVGLMGVYESDIEDYTNLAPPEAVSSRQWIDPSGESSGFAPRRTTLEEGESLVDENEVDLGLIGYKRADRIIKGGSIQDHYLPAIMRAMSPHSSFTSDLDQMKKVDPTGTEKVPRVPFPSLLSDFQSLKLTLQEVPKRPTTSYAHIDRQSVIENRKKEENKFITKLKKDAKQVWKYTEEIQEAVSRNDKNSYWYMLSEVEASQYTENVSNVNSRLTSNDPQEKSKRRSKFDPEENFDNLFSNTKRNFQFVPPKQTGTGLRDFPDPAEFWEYDPQKVQDPMLVSWVNYQDLFQGFIRSALGGTQMLGNDWVVDWSKSPFDRRHWSRISDFKLHFKAQPPSEEDPLPSEIQRWVRIDFKEGEIVLAQIDPNHRYTSIHSIKVPRNWSLVFKSYLWPQDCVESLPEEFYELLSLWRREQMRREMSETFNEQKFDWEEMDLKNLITQPKIE